MCIRDSLAPALNAKGVVAKSPPSADPEGETRPPSAGKSAAVSYTHLRAHETVLDLVCRLLLEKQKSPSDHMQLLYTLTNHYTPVFDTE